MTAVELAAVAARLLQFTAAAILCGAALFFLYGHAPGQRARWPARLVRAGAWLGAAGTAAWLMAQTAQIGETVGDAFDPGKVWSVSAETGFGKVTLLRLALFVFGGLLTFAPWRDRRQWLALAAVGAAASATFAWTGHGAREDGPAGLVHAAADVVHLLAAATWIGALFALAILLLNAGRKGAGSGAGREALDGLARFSGIGVAVVAALVASGLANSWFLVGPDRLAALLTTDYGRVLLAKLALFGLMLLLAAVNRYRITPRLEAALSADGTTRPFRPAIASIVTETILALLVLASVSWLGTLSPPGDG